MESWLVHWGQGKFGRVLQQNQAVLITPLSLFLPVTFPHDSLTLPATTSKLLSLSVSLCVCICVVLYVHAAAAAAMGNLCGCLAQKPVNKKKAAKRLANANANAATLSSNSSNRWTRIRSSRKEKFDDALIQEQALAAATIILQQHNASLPFDRSASLRYPNSTGSKKNQLPRSSSSRARSLTDPLLQPHQLVNQVFLSGFSFFLFKVVEFHGFVGVWIIHQV